MRGAVEVATTFGTWLDSQTERQDDAGWIARCWHASGPKGADGRANTRPRRYGWKSVSDWVNETLSATLDQGSPGRTAAALAVLKQAFEGEPAAAETAETAQVASPPVTPQVAEAGRGLTVEELERFRQLNEQPLIVAGEGEQPDPTVSGPASGSPSTTPTGAATGPDEPPAWVKEIYLTGDSHADLERIGKAMGLEPLQQQAPQWAAELGIQLDIMTALIGVIGRNAIPGWNEQVAEALAGAMMEGAAQQPMGVAEQAAAVFQPPAAPEQLVPPADPGPPPGPQEFGAWWSGSQ